jgi:hypothetical protein
VGVILPQPGQLRPDRSNSYGLDALVSNVNTYAVALVDLSQAGTNIVLTGPQMVAGVVRLIGTAAGNFNITLPPTPRIIDALGPTVPLDGSFSVEISVQNEDATFEAILTPGDASTTINGTAIVAPGTRRIWLLTVGSPFDYTVCSIQNIGTFSTTSVTPGGGTVTSVAQTVPVEFQVIGSPVTSTGTLAISKVNETANTVWAGPTTGSAAQPTFRALVTADLPGGVGSGTVTSVAATVPVEFAISGSPITTSGTLAITKATESANLVWAGPTTGAPAQPTFRAIVAADLPGSLNLNQTFATIGNESATLSNSRQLAAGTNITLTDGGAGSTLTIASTAAGGGGTLQSQVFTTSGTFTVPTNVSAVWITMIGGGGSGASSVSSGYSSGAGGGGAGELAERFLIPVNSGDSCAVVCGAGGGVASTSPGNSGAPSSFDNNSFTFSVLGGVAGGYAGSATSVQGMGGGPNGGFASAANSAGVLGGMESPAHIGGASGGNGGNTSSPYQGGLPGGGAPGYVVGAAGGSTSGSSGNGGGGGAATIWGLGGAGGNAGAAGISAASTSSGAGGGGGGQGNFNGGAGANGRVEVYWIG